MKPLLVFVSSFAYYILLSAKQFTWIFASGDSGDWLAASNMWFVPQPYGSPLYISLGHFLDLFGGDLVIKMTVILSCLPAAITVTLVYLIVKKLATEKAAWFSIAILLGAGIFLTQSTVLEEYAIATMFLVASYYFYLIDKKWLVAVSLGLGTAVHVVVPVVAVLWLLVMRKEWRAWVKVIPVFAVIGFTPYLLIVYLMTTDAPQLLAGGLSWQSINSYLGSTGVFGSLSIIDLPKRTLDFVAVVLMSFGLAVIPFFAIFKRRPWNNNTKLVIAAIFFPVFYYATCLDPTSWTFMTFACPFVAIIAGIEVARITNRKLVMAIASVTILIIFTNTIMLNADRLTKANPMAVEYYNEVQQIPDGSAIVMVRGGFNSMAVFYAISEGKDIIPIFLTNYDWKEDALYTNYADWINKEYNLVGNNTQELAYSALQQGIDTYVISNIYEKWKLAFEVEKTELEHFDKAKGVNTTVEVHTEANKYDTW